MAKIWKVPVAKLALCHGVVAEDVMSSDGCMCLLPKGTNLSLDTVRNSLPLVVRQLKRRGITTLLIRRDEEEYSLDSLQKIVEQLDLPFAREMDRSFARHTVSQVKDVYSRIASNSLSGSDFGALVETGKLLAQEIERVPQVLMSLSDIRSQDEYTYVHSLNVSLLAGYLAKRLFPEDTGLMEAVTVGGLLHDLGKTRIPLDILNKPGKLSDEEFESVKVHPLAGEELARQSGIDDPRVLGFIRYHHERWGGRGYPDNLKGDAIPFCARIGAVADVFDALTTKRVYKGAYHNARALQVIISNSGSHFDKSVVRVLLSSVGLYPPGSVVELSDGSVGVVLGNREGDLLRPLVLLQDDPYGIPYEEPRVLDLHSDEVELFVKTVLGSASKRSLPKEAS